ncbi:hypothetical protein LZ31DRAFT_551899 [Colletotrichum somersetense]|nr:hypothetical protein LZ31DRAFT_551899 [Colletotrichum somersetense]
MPSATKSSTFRARAVVSGKRGGYNLSRKLPAVPILFLRSTMVIPFCLAVSSPNPPPRPQLSKDIALPGDDVWAVQYCVGYRA